MPERILVIGAGFTGGRAARLLASGGHDVRATRTTHSEGFLQLELPDAAPLLALPGAGWRVLWTAPETAGCEALAGKAARVVYLSTTGVYGAASAVDEQTAPAPVTPRAAARLDAEQRIQAGPWDTLVLRPAAIYGPGRGVHESIRAGRWRIAGDGGTYTSRIHVDDLAAIAAASVLSEMQGAFPVADEDPCTNLAITQFCCQLLGAALPPSVPAGDLDETRRADRQVDGGAILRLLGITLLHKSYKTGIPAALAAAS